MTETPARRKASALNLAAIVASVKLIASVERQLLLLYHEIEREDRMVRAA